MPLRTRLALYYVGFFAAALIALHGGLYLLVHQALMSNIDNELRLGAQLLQRGFSDSNKSPRAYFNGEQLVLFLRQPPVKEFEATNLYVQVYREDGELLISSPNLQQPIAPHQELLDRALAGEQVMATDTTGEIRLRVLYAPLYFTDPVRNEQTIAGVIQIARSLGEVDRALQWLLYALVGGGVVVLLAAARGGTWLTRAAFRPIDEISHTAQSIVHASDLSRRVPVPPVQDELQRLTVTINQMIERMEGLFSVQRRFIADVSHELRTPLAAMRGNLDVLDRGAARDPELLSESLTDMRREVNRLIRMANDLLLLAQSDAGVQLHCGPVELDTLLLEVHRDLQPLAGDVGLHIGDEDQVVVIGDRDRIKQALLNLGVNALQHTPPGGTVTLSLQRAGAYALLRVRDTGTGIAPEALPLIFERFYRADRARSRGGAGLGLSIVKTIVDAHHGRIEVESSPGQGSTFTIELPLPNDEQAMPAAVVSGTADQL